MKKSFLAMLLLAASLGATAQEGTLVDGVAAIVGRNIIKHSDIDRTIAQMRVKQSVGDEATTRCAILENLVLAQLMIHKGEVDSVEVSDDDVKQYVDYYLKNDLRQYGSKEGLRDATGFTYDELKEQYERMIRNNLLSRRVEYQLTENVKVTPAEVTEFFNTLPADSLPMMPERYELSEIVIEPSVTEAERDRVRAELATLRERVIKGEKFSMLATLYSQDPASAKQGGELGFFSRGDMVGEFEAAAFALKPGEVSPIVETKFGFHIIQLIERRGNMLNARHILLIPKVSSDDLLRARIRLDSLAAAIRDGKITFEDAARQFSTAPNARQGGSVTNPADGSGRLDKPFVDEHYYNVGVSGMDEGRISNALPTKTDEQRDAYRIVRLNKKYPAHRANLTDDYDNIYNAALTTAKQRYIRKWAQRQLKNTYTRFDAPYQGCVFQNLQ